jgi:uncharacterized protein YukE
MPSAVEAFCEKHNLTTMLNLLRYSSSPVNGMQEVFAVDLLGELLAGNQELKTELENLKKQINPLARAAMHRAEFKKFNDDMALKQKEMEKLMGEIKHLKKDLLEQRRGRISTPPPPAPTSPPADANGYQQETQLFETSPPPQEEQDETQAGNAWQEYQDMTFNAKKK